MGHNRRWRVLSDASRYKADFALICRACGREVIIERETFVAIAALWGLGSDVTSIAKRLRCEVCGHRGNIFEMASPGLPHALKLREGDSLPPRRMSITRWLKMSDSKRKRYRRLAR